MRTSTIALFAASLATVFTLGCRGDDSSDGDNDDDTDADSDQPDGETPDGDDPDGDASDGVTIFQVQGTEVADNAPIVLDDVIVTAIDKYGMRTGTFFVQDPAGGEFSGVLVFGASPADVEALTLGDHVRIEGAKKQEFTGPTSGPFQDGESTTEVVPESTGSMIVTVLESGTVPAPATVDALAIAQLPDYMARNAEWEKWEGVLVRVNNVSVTSATECVGSACPDETNTTTEITGDIDIQTSLAALPGDLAQGDCLASVTGVVDYFYSFHIYNTTPEAVATNGAACPAAETTLALCTDTIDNDGNGFADCEDRNCFGVNPACSTAATIENIQNGTAMGNVQLDDVIVTGISFNKKNLWVSQSLTAAPNQGVYVFRGGSAAELPANIEIGAKVDVTGTVVEFNDMTPGETLTELTNSTVTFVAAPTTPPVAITGQTVGPLKVAATGEPYEGVLVTLTNVALTAYGAAPGFLATLTQGGTTFRADDDIYRFVDDDMSNIGDCYASITGLWSFNPYENEYVFIPRGVGTGAGTCN